MASLKRSAQTYAVCKSHTLSTLIESRISYFLKLLSVFLDLIAVFVSPFFLPTAYKRHASAIAVAHTITLRRPLFLSSSLTLTGSSHHFVRTHHGLVQGLQADALDLAAAQVAPLECLMHVHLGRFRHFQSYL